MPPSLATSRRRILTLAWLPLTLSACQGVDPFLANPPPPTRPDAVLRTPPALQAGLARAAGDEAEQAQRLAWVIGATRDGRIEAVERHLFEESDRITGTAGPRLEAQHRALRAAMAQVSALRGHVF